MRAGFIAAVVLTTAASCVEYPAPPNAAGGALAVVWTDDDGSARTGDQGAYRVHTFPWCGSARPITVKIVLRNVGRTDLWLAGARHLAGDPVTFGTVPAAGAQWSVEFTEGAVLTPAERLEVDARFTPSEGDWDGSSTEIEFFAEGAAAASESTRVVLDGRLVSLVCEMPKVLEFGSVAVGDSFVREVEVRNPSAEPIKAYVGESIGSSGGDHGAFSLEPGTPTGEIVIPPDSNLRVRFRFAPIEARAYLAFIRMRASPCCAEQVVQLTGAGVGRVLSADPAEVDCGDVIPGAEARRSVAISNVGNFDAKLSNAPAAGDSQIHFAGPDGGVPPDLVVVGGSGGSVQLTVVCMPAGYGLHATTLVLGTDAPGQPTLEIAARVTGAVP